MSTYLVKVDDRRPVRDVLGQHVGELDPLSLQQSQVVLVWIKMRVRGPITNAKALVESAQSLPLHLDFVDLLDLCAPLLDSQVRPVSQALSG